MRFVPEAGLMRVSWNSLFGNCFGDVPLRLGEGGAKRRVRAGNAPSSGPSGHLLPEGEGHEPPFRLIWTPVLPVGEGGPEGPGEGLVPFFLPTDLWDFYTGRDKTRMPRCRICRPAAVGCHPDHRSRLTA